MPGIDEKTLTAITKNFTSIRTSIKTEIFKGIDGLGSGMQPYYEMNFMKTNDGQENEYVRQEKEIYKPIHQEFIKDGKRTSWGLSQLIVPVAEGSQYNYVTSNAFTDWDKSYSITIDDYYTTYNKLFPKTTAPQSARKMVKTEVWKLEVSAN